MICSFCAFILKWQYGIFFGILVEECNKIGCVRLVWGLSLNEFHFIFDGVVAELVEEDVSAVVCVDSVENGLGVGHPQSPLLQQGGGLREFGHRHPPVPAGVDLVEHEPVVGVFPQVLDQVFELGLRHVVVPVHRGGLEGGLGSGEGPDQDRLELEQLGQLDDVPDSLVDFGQAEVFVAVDVEVGPVLFGLAWVGRGVPCASLALMVYSF